MRLRNIPRAQSVLSQCAEVIKNETEHKGSWQEIFGNSHPIHIEIGMGKGKFLLSLASLHPEINYIGIERYSSVLLRAVEKFQDIPFGTETPRNIRFLCMDAQDIADVFAPGEVSRIYLNFPIHGLRQGTQGGASLPKNSLKDMTRYWPKMAPSSLRRTTACYSISPLSSWANHPPSSLPAVPMIFTMTNS